MERIASFCVDHTKLEPGIYISRIDGDIATYDIRMRKPNTPPFLSNPVLHSFEHLFATIARNSEYGGRVIYFGPMGCRTGFYMLLAGDYTSKDVVGLVTELFEFVRDFKGEVPGAAAKDCGNYLDMNLPMANYLGKRYLEQVLYNIKEDRLVYPE
mgnify:CR=1 FL=1